MKPNSLVLVGVTRQFEMTKTVKNKNLYTSNVSVTETEKNTIQLTDMVTLKVNDEDGDLVGGATYTGKQFQSFLSPREKKTKSGRKIHFYVLPYNKKK